MMGTIHNHHLAFDIGMLNDALDYHREHGTLDSDLARKLQARLDEKLALLDTPVARHTPTDGEPERRELDKRPRAGARAANQFGDFAVKVASPAQIAFIKRLMVERDTSRTPMRIPEINERLSKKVASDLIEMLLECPVRPDKQAEVAAAALATEKQIAAILREAPRRVYHTYGAIERTIADVQAGEPVDRTDASAALDVLLNAPFRPRETTATAALEAGVYRTPDGALYKVYPARADRTRMLAKLLNLDSDDASDRWVYQGMASRFVKSEHRMTREQAAAFGHEFGVCASCGAELTDPTSIDRGMGPVCWNRY